MSEGGVSELVREWLSEWLRKWICVRVGEGSEVMGRVVKKKEAGKG